MAVSLLPQDFLQPFVDQFIEQFDISACANDYNSQPLLGPVQTNAVHDLFQVPFLKPVFVVINCVSNSLSHAPGQLLFNLGGGVCDSCWDAQVINPIRAAIDSVNAPMPLLTDVRKYNSQIQFTFLGQIGKTNRVESTTNLLSPVSWTPVANYSGTNGPITFREASPLPGTQRFYRVRRM
jgi:hypothetical protein